MGSQCLGRHCSPVGQAPGTRRIQCRIDETCNSPSCRRSEGHTICRHASRRMTPCPDCTCSPQILASAVRQSDYHCPCRARPAAENHARKQLDLAIRRARDEKGASRDAPYLAKSTAQGAVAHTGPNLGSIRLGSKRMTDWKVGPTAGLQFGEMVLIVSVNDGRIDCLARSGWSGIGNRNADVSSAIKPMQLSKIARRVGRHSSAYAHFYLRIYR